MKRSLPLLTLLAALALPAVAASFHRESEAWVVPLDDEERKPGAILDAVAKIKDDYQSRYIKQWVAFLDDIVVRSPTTVPEALAMLEELTRSDYPLVLLLGAVVVRVARDEVVTTRHVRELMEREGI